MEHDEQDSVAELFFQLNSDSLANSLAAWSQFLKVYSEQLLAAGFDPEDVLKLLHLLNIAMLSGQMGRQGGNQWTGKSS